MTNNESQIDRRFRNHWFLYSTLGYGLGGLFGLGLLIFMGSSAIYFFGGGMAGILVGLEQWQAIRLKFSEANKYVWMIGNILGMAISWTLFRGIFGAYSLNTLILPMLVSGAFWGLIAGITQWFTLNRQSKRSFTFFVLSSVLGVVIFSLGWAWLPLGNIISGGSNFGLAVVLSIISWLLAGIVAGAASSRLLSWLMQPLE